MVTHLRALALAGLVLPLAAACRSAGVVQLSEPEEAPPATGETRLAAELPTEPPPSVDRRARVIGYDRSGISVYDPETGQRRDLLRSPLWMPEADLQEISSSGLIAVRTVSEEWVPIDLALTILSVPEGRLVKHIPLFSPELQQQLEDDRYSLTWNDTDWALALLDRWFRPHWSPDGQSVAFAAALDGHSADVYLYDLGRDELRRLTEGVNQAVVLGMSPDSEWVAYVEGFDFEWNYYEVSQRERIGYFSGPLRAVSTSSGRIVELYRSNSFRRISLVDWYSPTEFALTEAERSLGNFYLYRADVVSRNPVLLYGGGFEGVDLDPESRVAAFTIPQQGVLPYGVHLVEASSHETVVTLDEPETGGFAGPIHWYPEVGSFFTEAEAGIVAISPTGDQLVSFDGQYCLPRASPDGRLLAFWGCGIWTGISLYYSSGEWFSDYEVGFASEVVWGAGANELYVLESEVDSQRLSRISLSTGEIELLDANARTAIARVAPRPMDLQSVQLEPTEPPNGRSPSPTPLPVPTRSSSGALTATGPWLLNTGYDALVAANLDGSGLTYLFQEVPDLDEPSLLLQIQSTQAGWVAAQTFGSEDRDFMPILLVTGLPATEARYELALLSTELAAGLMNSLYGEEYDAAAEQTMLAVYGGFGFDTLAWAPNGRLLAFVAALDGDSADVYMLDTVSGEQRRLTDGPNQPRLIGWSPDGRWVLHQEVRNLSQEMYGLEFNAVATWAAAADGSGARPIPGIEGTVVEIAWVSDTQFVAWHSDPGPGLLHRLTLADVERGALSTLMRAAVVLWEAGPEPGMLAVDVRDRSVEPAGRARYLLSRQSGAPELRNLDQWLEQNLLGSVYEWIWSPELDALLVRTSANSVIAVDTALEQRLAVFGECSLPLASPDGVWLAFGSCYSGADGLRVYNVRLGSFVSVTEVQAYPRAWLPDSSGLYYEEEAVPNRRELMFVEVPGGVPWLVTDATYDFGYALQVVGDQD